MKWRNGDMKSHSDTFATWRNDGSYTSSASAVAVTTSTSAGNSSTPVLNQAPGSKRRRRSSVELKLKSKKIARRSPVLSQKGEREQQHPLPLVIPSPCFRTAGRLALSVSYGNGALVSVSKHLRAGRGPLRVVDKGETRGQRPPQEPFPSLTPFALALALPPSLSPQA